MKISADKLNGSDITSLAKYGIYIAAAILVLSALLSSSYVVDPGRVGVVTRFGEIIDVADEGLHMKIPFIDDVSEISSSIQTVDVNATAVSKDMQQVNTNVNVQYTIPVAVMKEIYTNYRGDIKSINSALVVPGTETITKMVTAGYNAEQLISMREIVGADLKGKLSKHFLANGKLNLVKADITEFGFGESFTKAIEDKVVAQQSVLTESKNQERKKIESQQTVAIAQAEAESIRLRADAEAYAIQKQNQYATPMNVKMREAEAKITAAEAMKSWKVTVLGATPLINVDANSEK